MIHQLSSDAILYPTKKTIRYRGQYNCKYTKYTKKYTIFAEITEKYE